MGVVVFVIKQPPLTMKIYLTCSIHSRQVTVNNFLRHYDSLG